MQETYGTVLGRFSTSRGTRRTAVRQSSHHWFGLSLATKQDPNASLHIYMHTMGAVAGTIEAGGAEEDTHGAPCSRGRRGPVVRGGRPAVVVVLVELGPGPGHRPGAVGLEQELVLAALDAEPSALPPVLAPGVADEPEPETAKKGWGNQGVSMLHGMPTAVPLERILCRLDVHRLLTFGCIN